MIVLAILDVLTRSRQSLGRMVPVQAWMSESIYEYLPWGAGSAL